MKNKFSLNWLLLLFLIVQYGCTQKSSKKASNNSNFDQTTNWAILKKENSTQDDNIFTWDFNIKNSIDYDVQIVFDELPEKPSAAFIIDDLELKSEFKEHYTTYNQKQVLELENPIKLNVLKKKHVFKIKTNLNFNEIRIVPNFKNYVGSGIYHQEWLKMHTSPEKQASLKWFKKSKFGMFIHWGLYSQTGGIWKGTKINQAPFPGPKVAEWIMHAFQIPRKEYATLAKTFNPNKSFAQNIAKLAKQSGMKYVVITSKHHDGFALFDSKSSTHDIIDATPYKKDAVKELYEACLEEGLGFGVYYSHGNDWNDGSDGSYTNIKKVHDSLGIYTHKSGKNLWDPSPNTHASYYETKAYPQVKELTDLLPELKLIWFDGEGFTTEKQSFKFYKMIYNKNPSIIVNRRVGWSFGDYLDAGDNKIPDENEKLDKYWETCGTTNNSWGYKSYDHDWKSTKELLYYFVDILSKGGNYLLNIGPDGKGNVPKPSENRLLEMGEWIHINSEAVYNTVAWTTKHEGNSAELLNGTGHREKKGFNFTFTQNDFWFTAKEKVVYAISLMPSSNKIIIKSLGKNAGTIKDVKFLNQHFIKNWSQTEKGLIINLHTKVSNKNGFVIKVQF